MSINKRQPMTSLRPLTQAQADFLIAAGYVSAIGKGDKYYKAHKYRVWWSLYFHEKDQTDPAYQTFRDLDAYTNAYATLGNPQHYTDYLFNLQGRMRLAYEDREVWKQMKLNSEFPPDPDPRDPYKLPAYFGWVQAEVAFRRGYMRGVEEIVTNALKKTLKEADDFTPEVFEELAKCFYKDPIMRDYFMKLAEVYGGANAPSEVSLKAMFDDIMRKRERAYQQFSPYFYPHRSVQGSGFSGFSKRGFR